MHSALIQRAVSAERSDEHFLCTLRCPKACPQACPKACPQACPQACVPEGVPEGRPQARCARRRVTEEPDGRHGGCMNSAWYERACVMCPKGDIEEPSGRHGTREHA